MNSELQFEFATARRVVFGPGSIRQAGPAARAAGRRALIVTGRREERARGLLDILQRQGIAWTPFPVPGEPEVETVRSGIALARRERCDFVISFGGGSALDAGKAIAAMLANPGDLLDYLEIVGGGRQLARPAAPFIAIPTTAGTGSEATRNSVLASPGHRLKVSLRSPFLLPETAIVDPELTYDLPPALTATTGMDALTQLIEPFVCLRANPITDALCAEGIPRVARSLPRAFQNGDRAARRDMALASLFGGMALANAGLGAVHGLAGPLGGMSAAPHGALCAALLPNTVEINLRALRSREPASPVLGRFNQVARLLTGNSSATADDAVDWLRRLTADLDVPNLSRYGITREHIAEAAAKAAQASSMKANPIVLTPGELAEILERAI